MLAVAALPFPDIDPVALSLGPLVIRWYALAYVVGIVLGYAYIKRLNQQFTPPIIPTKPFEDMMMWAILGIILGGRLGYILFYKPAYYFAHPAEIFMLWQGGMAFHGGIIGVTLSFFLFARRFELPFLRIMDMVAAAAPIGLFFGRLANFVNGELFGRMTDAPWGIIFPAGGPLPRHPSQLYEAALEGVLLFILLRLLWSLRSVREKQGVVAGCFLIGYATARFCVEYVREPDAHLGLLSLGLSMGQWLCIPMALLGAGVIIWARR